MTVFDRALEQQQVAWRKRSLPVQVSETHGGLERAWILPPASWTDGLWAGIRAGDGSVPEYLRSKRIQRHAGSNNLKSSWVLCANLYFPFRSSVDGLSMLAGFLQAHVAPEIRSVDAVELEYAEDGALSPAKLLGEKGGSRGAGQTSPDVAFLVNGRKGLVLTESKLAEHSFYACSARRTDDKPGRPGNPDPSRCTAAPSLPATYASECHQEAWGRKDWSHLAPAHDPDHWRTLHHCPAADGGYQLFRQQALAEGIAASGIYSLVVSCVALDARNHTLRESLSGTGLSDVRDFGRLFRGKARFAVFEHQQWVRWVRDHDEEGNWSDWLRYVEDRYQYGPEDGASRTR